MTTPADTSVDQLIPEVAQLMVTALNLDMPPAEIDPDAPLYGDGLGLDSIDALELGLALQKRYGVTLAADSEETRRHFASVRALADFVASQGKV